MEEPLPTSIAEDQPAVTVEEEKKEVVEEPQVEEPPPAVEETPVEEPKVDEPKAEEPKVDEPAEPPPPPEPKPIVPGSMRELYNMVPAALVEAEFSELAKTWPTWESATHTPAIVDNKVHFTYDGDYGSERVLVSSGRATIIPDDSSPPITIGPGDAVHLHYGFSCTWHVLEPMVQSYGYFDKEGAEIAENELTCDVCGGDCFAESYLFNDEVDICPRCFRSDAKGAEEYVGAQYQRAGKDAKPPPPKRSPAKLESPEGGKKVKKAKVASGDYVPPGEGEGEDGEEDGEGKAKVPKEKKEKKPKEPKVPKEKKPKEPKEKKEKKPRAKKEKSPSLPEHRWFADGEKVGPDGEKKGPRVKYTE